MAVKKKSDTRELAAVLATYSLSFPLDDYEVFVGLVLNLDRVRMMDAVSVARGFGVVQNADEVGTEWADAMVMDEAEVGQLHFKLNKARVEVRNRARRAARQMGA